MMMLWLLCGTAALNAPSVLQRRLVPTPRAHAPTLFEPTVSILFHRAQTASALKRQNPEEWDWCPHLRRTPRDWLSLARALWATLVANFLRMLDPSTRFPKPKPAPLSVLASSVGKETLIENKYGRKAKIKTSRRPPVMLRRRNIDAYSALAEGLFDC